MECMEWKLCNGMYEMKCMQWNGMEYKYGMDGMECMGWNIWTTMYVWNELNGMFGTESLYGTEYYKIWTRMYGMKFM